MIDWNSQLRVRLTSEGGGAEETASLMVFPSYGDTKLRLVQAVANRVGGIVVYFEASKDGTVHKVVPVTAWSDGGICNVMMSVGTFIDYAERNSMQITCYGSDRRRWKLSVESVPSDTDPMDNLSDRALAGDGRPDTVEVVEPNGIRTEF